jgi:hypothetical protein
VDRQRPTRDGKQTASVYSPGCGTIRHALESRKDTGARAGANSVLKTTN